MKILSFLPPRGSDDWGSGEFGAARGNHKHRGIDLACYPQTEIMSPVGGKVTKLGYPYADDLSYRYVEIEDSNSYKHRFFYVQPLVEVGELVTHGDVIGHAQDIASRYTRHKILDGEIVSQVMKNHVHYEILDKGAPIDPGRFV